jgi:hypothetical protein
MKTKYFYDENLVNSATLKIKYVKNNKTIIEKNYTKANLLIPEDLKDFYLNQIKKHKTKVYLKELVKNYKSILLNGCLEKYNPESKLNTAYQEKDLNLIKMSIYVEAEVWAELKQLKNFLNWSICRIVSFLVYLDWIGIVENIPREVVDMIVPEKNSFSLHYKSEFNSRFCLYRRKLYYRMYT